MAEEKVVKLRIKLHIFVWLCLLGLTAANVAVARLHLTDHPVATAVGIATVQASLALALLMHFRQEPWILKIMLFLVLAALLFIIALTFSDIWFRYR